MVENVDENMLENTSALATVQDFENIWRHFMSNWQRQRIVAVLLICYIVHLVCLLDIQAMLVSKPPRNSRGTSSSKGRKRKASMMEMLATQYEKLNTSIECLTDVLERGNVIAEKFAKKSLVIAEKSLAILESSRPCYYKEEEIYAELEMIGVHPDFVMNAYCYLSNDPSATRAFFGLPRNRRLEWLKRVMGNV